MYNAKWAQTLLDLSCLIFKWSSRVKVHWTLVFDFSSYILHLAYLNLPSAPWMTQTLV